jgi:hypothetical protein
MAGQPRKKLRRVQDLRSRAVELLRELQTVVPSRCQAEPEESDSLPTLAWKWSLRSVGQAVADLGFLETALVGKLPAVSEGSAADEAA